MFLRSFVALLLIAFFVSDAAKITCASIRCPGHCTDTPVGAKCSTRNVRRSPPHPCAFTTCPPALKCIAFEGRASCVQF